MNFVDLLKTYFAPNWSFLFSLKRFIQNKKNIYIFHELTKPPYTECVKTKINEAIWLFLSQFWPLLSQELF